ncbi:disintegrin and metalloproteinase domain-containing protein 10-like [Sycon ciliatum]|uniref:disintegrin and metalloproteinase domain-containing protein 10-like n=1 Tax=Sycon ciliatum TaxID=27933 RepID=UPI0020AC3137|eukprot:scpid46387/ scgid7771/ Disintegrin and metalloproteinase domain-containing protein 10; Kuzbanian protein homolog
MDGPLVLAFILLAASSGVIGRSSSLHKTEFIRHYDTVRLRPLVLAALKQVHKGHPVMALSFTALGRDFTLNLQTQNNLFTDSASLCLISDTGVAYKSVNKAMFYTGTMSGERWSSVHGAVKAGLFHGVVHTHTHHYHMEPMALFDNVTASGEGHDTIVYDERHVAYPHPFQHSCAASNSTRLRRIQESARTPHPLPPLDANRVRRRQKRAFDEEKKTCRVTLVADYTFFTEAMNQDEADTQAELAFHLNEASRMFSATDFLIPDSGQEVTDINFQIHNITIYKTEPNRFTGEFGTDDMLSAFSALDFDSVCLAHLFLHRDFKNGVLGLAWVASPGGSIGGICQKRTRTSNGDLNLNTGFTTVYNFNARVPRSVSTITTTHEFGHNFGSPHDPDGPCVPGGSDGNYIMYYSATDGTKPNNQRFSTCSRTSMAAVLSTKATCFDIRRESSTCGNGIREGAEECDCGSDNNETCRANDPCCRPGNCTLLPGNPCTAKWDVCCRTVTSPQNVTMCVLAGEEKPCSYTDECQLQQFCNGENKTCLPSPTPDGTLCNGNLSTCSGGACSGSLCAVYGANACDCTTPGRECDLCCVINSNCTSLRDPGLPFNLSTGVSRPANAPCKDYTGYCRVDEDAVRCITVDDNDPLDDLKDIFNTITVGSILEWLKKHWPETLGGFGGAIVLFILLRVTYRPKKLDDPSRRGELEESVPLLSRRS